MDRSSGATIRYNFVHDCVKAGILIFGYDGVHSTGNSIYDNLVWSINVNGWTVPGYSMGIGAYQVETTNIFNNTIWNVTPNVNSAVLYVSGDAGQTYAGDSLENNIVGPALGASRSNLRTRGAGTYTSFASDYNDCYDSAGLVLIDSGNTYNTLAAYQAGSGQDAHSLNADPKFRNATGADFTLLLPRALN